MDFADDVIERQYALLVEGSCPNGHGPLERRALFGYCRSCEMGWQVQGDTVYVVSARTTFLGDEFAPAQGANARPPATGPADGGRAPIEGDR